MREWELKEIKAPFEQHCIASGDGDDLPMMISLNNTTNTPIELVFISANNKSTSIGAIHNALFIGVNDGVVLHKPIDNIPVDSGWGIIVTPIKKENMIGTLYFSYPTPKILKKAREFDAIEKLFKSPPW